MAKHTTEEQRTGTFINALLNGGSDASPVERVVEVQEVRGGMVIFRALLGTVAFLQTILKMPLRLAEFVYHSVRKGDTEVNTPPFGIVSDDDIEVELVSANSSIMVASPVLVSAGKAEEHPLTEALDWNIGDILTHIFTPKAIEEFGLSEYVESGYGMVTNHNEQRSKASAKRKAGGYEIIQLAFSSPEQILKILMGKQKPIDSEDDIEAEEVTPVGTSIFAVNASGKVVDTVFNVDAFKQMLQHYIPVLAEEAPVIAQVAEDTYSIDLDQLKLHIGKHVSELIFHPEVGDSGQVFRPVGIPTANGAFAEMSGAESFAAGKKALFHIAIDVSSSMSSSLSTLKEKLNVILADIIDSCENWEIVLTDFATTSNIKIFSSDSNNLLDLQGYVSGLYTRNMTKLYGTMHDQFSSVLQNHANYSSVAVMVFTDGEDNKSREVDSVNVTQSVLQSRESVSNLQIFTVELGQSNAEFFTQLASEAGCTHVNLNKIGEFEQLQQYSASLAANSHVLSFLDEALQVHRQVMVEGEISVGVDTVSDRDNVTMYGGNIMFQHQRIHLLV